MNKKLKELLELADEYGVTVDDLLREKELGAKVDKPFTLAIRFTRLQDLVDFAHETICKWDESEPGCVWKADGLDPEFGTRGGTNNYVIRGDKGVSKPESMRVSNADGSLAVEGSKALPKCPRCEGFIPNNDTPGAFAGAISRLDDETEICSSCGVEEALLQYQGLLADWRN
jgi:hypothetical protein